jgi:hypothetical protein
LLFNERSIDLALLDENLADAEPQGGIATNLDRDPFISMDGAR